MEYENDRDVVIPITHEFLSKVKEQLLNRKMPELQNFINLYKEIKEIKDFNFKINCIYF